MTDFVSVEDFAIKVMSLSAGTVTVRFRRGVNLDCFEDLNVYPGMWTCVHQKSMREHIREIMDID